MRCGAIRAIFEGAGFMRSSLTIIQIYPPGALRKGTKRYIFCSDANPPHSELPKSRLRRGILQITSSSPILLGGDTHRALIGFVCYRRAHLWEAEPAFAPSHRPAVNRSICSIPSARQSGSRPSQPHHSSPYAASTPHRFYNFGYRVRQPEGRI